MIGGLSWKKDSERPHKELFEEMRQYCIKVLGIKQHHFSYQDEFHGEYECEINLSGGWEWHQPTYSIALGLNHKLGEEELEEKYLIAYHGTRKNQNVPLILESELKPGPAQAFQNSTSRDPDTKVPHGIYCSPFLTVAMGYVNPTFPIVFQIAAPSQIVTNNKGISVISKAIPLKLVFPFLGVVRQANQ